MKQTPVLLNECYEACGYFSTVVFVIVPRDALQIDLSQSFVLLDVTHQGREIWSGDLVPRQIQNL